MFLSENEGTNSFCEVTSVILPCNAKILDNHFFCILARTSTILCSYDFNQSKIFTLILILFLSNRFCVILKTAVTQYTEPILTGITSMLYLPQFLLTFGASGRMSESLYNINCKAVKLQMWMSTSTRFLIYLFF